ncbi:MAG: hypothetical protein ABSF75_01380 [Terracidiphilus sp.]|jgi:hypothetical protein
MNQVNQAVPLPGTESNSKLVGIGGWLLLLIIKLWAGTALRILAGAALPNHAEGMLNVGFGLLSGIAAFLLTTKNRKGVLFAKIFLIVEAAYYVLELLPPISVDNPVKTAGFFAASILYLVYLFRSKRVKNTYFPQPSL